MHTNVNANYMVYNLRFSKRSSKAKYHYYFKQTFRPPNKEYLQLQFTMLLLLESMMGKLTFTQ